MAQLDLQENKTFICTMIGWEDPGQTIEEGRRAVADGTDGLIIGLERIRPEFRNAEAIGTIARAFSVPCMLHFYRKDSWSKDLPGDETIAQTLLAAADAGIAMVDVMGDLFDPSPDERTKDPAAITRQRKLVDALHAHGAQVVMSSHPLRPMTGDEISAQLTAFEERGADVVKIVTLIDTEEQFLDAVATTLRLRREIKKPFIFIAGGKYGYAHRIAGLELGVAISFTVIDREGWRKDIRANPLTRTMRAVRDHS